MSCRLCLDGGEEKELLTPCACRGSAGHVHAECLLEWCDHVGEYKKCDVCHQRPGCKEVFYICRLKFPKFHLIFNVFRPLDLFAALSSYKKDPSSSLRCFVGPAALLAARHRFRRAEALPEEDPEVLEATYQVAQALAAEGQCLNV